MRYWLREIGDGLIEFAAYVVIGVGKGCSWLAYKILSPVLERDVERINRQAHLKQVIQDDLNGEPWGEFPEFNLDSEDWRTWKMQHDDEKEDR